MINISPPVKEALLVILPFLNEISGVISDSVPPKSPLYKFYTGLTKVMIDYIVLVSICWSASITTNTTGDVGTGVAKGSLTLLLAFIIPNLFMESVIGMAGPKATSLSKFFVGIVFIIILMLAEKISWTFFKAEEERFTDAIVKDVDKTDIRVIVHKWSDDFIYRFKNHEPEENKALCSLLEKLKPGSFVVDAGGHVGDTGLYLAKCIKDRNLLLNVVIIEPDISKIQFISKMVMYNELENVIIVNKAVGSKSGIGELDKEGHPGGWKVKEIKGQKLEKLKDIPSMEDSVEILTKSGVFDIESLKHTGTFTIDTLDNITKNKEVSLLHLDVDGMEGPALEGAKQIIKDAKYIMVELNKKSNKKDIDELLSAGGFDKATDKGFENGNILYSK